MANIPFSLPLWRYTAGKWSWYFITLSYEDADFIRWIQDKTVVWFGFVRVEVTIGSSIWQTSIFPTKEWKYLLAIKAEIRKKERLSEGNIVNWTIHLL
jgi:hypothetical protein